jgi:hypothetical protein
MDDVKRIHDLPFECRAYSSSGLRTPGFFASCGAGSGLCGAGSGLLPCSASGLFRPSERFLRAAGCAPARGDVFAHAGTISSTLLLPEQAASSIPNAAITTMRTMGDPLGLSV